MVSEHGEHQRVSVVRKKNLTLHQQLLHLPVKLHGSRNTAGEKNLKFLDAHSNGCAHYVPFSHNGSVPRPRQDRRADSAPRAGKARWTVTQQAAPGLQGGARGLEPSGPLTRKTPST